MYSTNTHRVLNFNVIRSTASCFRVTGHFETSAPNDTKQTLNII